jgi:flagellar protein FliO/FliZ
MNSRLVISVMACIGYQPNALAATGLSPTGGILKMLLGLVVVLAVMALISWGVKRLMPGVAGQNSAARIVGGVSVGSRERVVVLEIADRWIVVGVAPGQISAIANLEIGDNLSDSIASHTKSVQNNPLISTSINPMVQPLVKPFSEWLKKSTQKIKNAVNEIPNAKK